MIKGINKQVLEILEPSNGYFEKALFFVKPEYSGFSENKLKELAQSELKSALKPPLQKNTKALKRVKVTALCFSVFIAGISLGFVLANFI